MTDDKNIIVDPVLYQKVELIKENIKTLIKENHGCKDLLPVKTFPCVKCNAFRDKYLYRILKNKEGNNTCLDFEIHECSVCHHKRILVVVDAEKGYGLELSLFLNKVLYEPFVKR